MHAVQWQAFIAQFAQLSQRQRSAGIALLRQGAPQDALVALIEQTARVHLHCPACASRHLHGEAVCISCAHPGNMRAPSRMCFSNGLQRCF
jgi:hypothetical protein